MSCSASFSLCSLLVILYGCAVNFYISKILKDKPFNMHIGLLYCVLIILARSNEMYEMAS